MIPLSWLLLAWLVMIALFLLLSIITILVYLRFGLSGFMTYASVSLFILVTAFVLFFTGRYFLTVEWTQTIHPFSTITPLFNF